MSCIFLQCLKSIFCLYWSVDSYSPDPGGQTTFYGSYKIAVLIWPVCSGKGLYALLQIFRKSFEKKTKEFSGFTEKCFHNEIFKIRWQFYCNTSSLRKDKPQFIRRVIPLLFSKNPSFLEIQDVPTFHRFIGKIKVLNNSCNQFVGNFYTQSILVLEECLQKW